MCSGVFNNHFITKFSREFAGEKKIENRSVFGDYMDKSLRLTFGGHPVD